AAREQCSPGQGVSSQDSHVDSLKSPPVDETSRWEANGGIVEGPWPGCPPDTVRAVWACGGVVVHRSQKAVGPASRRSRASRTGETPVPPKLVSPDHYRPSVFLSMFTKAGTSEM